MKKQFIKLAVLAFLFGAVMGITSTVSAQEPMPSDNEVNAIAKDLFCPVCENCLIEHLAKIFDINHILDAVRVAPNFDRFALSGFVN